MCHSPESARAFAVANPNPDEAPVIMQVDTVDVFLLSEGFWVSTGAATALALTELVKTCFWKTLHMGYQAKDKSERIGLITFLALD